MQSSRDSSWPQKMALPVLLVSSSVGVRDRRHPKDSCVPDRTGAATLARDYPIVSVHQEIFGDTVTPVTAFAKLCGSDETSFLLESVPVSGGVTRYSYIGHRPEPLASTECDPLKALRSNDYLTGIRSPRPTPLARCGRSCVVRRSQCSIHLPVAPRENSVCGPCPTCSARPGPVSAQIGS